MAQAKVKYKGAKYTSPEGRVSWPALFEPTLTYNGRNKGTGEKEFKVDILWDKKTDLKPFKAKCEEALTEVYGPKAEGKWPKNIIWPFKDQAESIEYYSNANKEVPEHLVAGAMQATFKTAEKNTVIVVGPDMETIMDSKEVYGGCYGKVNCQIKVNFIPSTKICYVTAYLQGFQKTREGEPFGSRPDAASMFEPVSNTEETSANSLLGD